MKGSKLFFALSIVFVAIGAMKMINGGDYAFRLIGLGSLFLAFGLGRRKGEIDAH